MRLRRAGRRAGEVAAAPLARRLAAHRAQARGAARVAIGRARPHQPLGPARVASAGRPAPGADEASCSVESVCSTKAADGEMVAIIAVRLFPRSEWLRISVSFEFR